MMYLSFSSSLHFLSLKIVKSVKKKKTTKETTQCKHVSTIEFKHFSGLNITSLEFQNDQLERNSKEKGNNNLLGCWEEK